MSFVNVFHNTDVINNINDIGPQGVQQISKESTLLALKVVDMRGDIYRVVFGKKTLITTEHLGEPNEDDIPDNAVVYTKEIYAGRKDVDYIVTTVELEGVTENSEPDLSFDFTLFSDFHMESFIFDYQVIPTMDKGPKLIKTFVSPALNHTFKGSLTEHAILASGISALTYDATEQEKTSAIGIPTNIAQQIKVVANTKLEQTISL